MTDGTWAPYPDIIARTLMLPDGTTFHDFFHDLTQSSKVSCNANRVNFNDPASVPGCCQAAGINNPGNNNDPEQGGANCQAGCLCCIAYQLQEAGAAQKDINTYVNAVITAGCLGVIGGEPVSDISQICGVNSNGCYTGYCATSNKCDSCTPFIPSPYRGGKCTGAPQPSWWSQHKTALIIAAVVLALLALGAAGYFLF